MKNEVPIKLLREMRAQVNHSLVEDAKMSLDEFRDLLETADSKFAQSSSFPEYEEAISFDFPGEDTIGGEGVEFMARLEDGFWSLVEMYHDGDMLHMVEPESGRVYRNRQDSGTILGFVPDDESITDFVHVNSTDIHDVKTGHVEVILNKGPDVVSTCISIGPRDNKFAVKVILGGGGDSYAPDPITSEFKEGSAEYIEARKLHEVAFPGAIVALERAVKADIERQNQAEMAPA